jgi:uncharacterized protein (TIGR00159 family)
MPLSFIHIRWVIDILDILLVAFLMYQIYILVRGTVAFNIIVALLAIWVLSFIVQFLQMKLLSTILNAIVGGGAIALIILFQQEIRRFLIHLGGKYFPEDKFSLQYFLRRGEALKEKVKIPSIHKASIKLAGSFTGALIVIARKSSLDLYAETGDVLNAKTSSRLLESIFLKNGPLHDGAVIIESDLIVSARCVLPFTSQTDLPPYYGMRHRAGLGISENTDAFVIIISEERGEISICEHGELISGVGEQELWHILKKQFD